MKLLILDNYDSFTYNLVHLIEKVSDISFEVFRNDQISLQDVNDFDKILLSPGPGLPKDAGIMPEVLQYYGPAKNILGVCLGFQAIGEAYGASLKNLPTVFHGLATPITVLQEDILFKNCPGSFTVGRYHSWVIDNQSVPHDFEITAVDEEGNIMAGRHKTFNVRGVQFHPESILSEYGETIMRNWLETS
ncbi:MAG: aminodeoxychorismate/anthranilate synthase component [Bacteroidetes bacterium]|nr:aminodeoxychorismate/anthranilate synthase component [Bacteroidota bacterium]MDF2453227.1 aminodeoxychorismate/anthranilate synthase component [Bacteroidota bacterium]